MNALKQARLESGMDVLEVAEKLGVSRQWLYMCEQGKRTPNVKRLKKLARMYGKSIDELVKEETT